MEVFYFSILRKWVMYIIFLGFFVYIGDKQDPPFNSCKEIETVSSALYLFNIAVSPTCPTADPLRKQQTFYDTTTGFLVKWRLRNGCRNSMLITHHYPDLGNVMSSVWNFCTLLSDITSQGNQWSMVSPNVSCFLRLHCSQQQHF